MSEMFIKAKFASFCERQEGYHGEIIDIRHFCRFQWKYNMQAIVQISPILYKFLIQTIGKNVKYGKIGSLGKVGNSGCWCD